MEEILSFRTTKFPHVSTVKPKHCGRRRYSHLRQYRGGMDNAVINGWMKLYR